MTNDSINFQADRVRCEITELSPEQPQQKRLRYIAGVCGVGGQRRKWRCCAWTPQPGRCRGEHVDPLGSHSGRLGLPLEEAEGFRQGIGPARHTSSLQVVACVNFTLKLLTVCERKQGNGANTRDVAHFASVVTHYFRGIVWQLLSGAHDSPVKKQFAEYIKATSACERIIRRDIARTYPEHDFFKEKDGLGQESLFNVMKAYSLHDREVGYCQGSGFIVGLLLLQVNAALVRQVAREALLETEGEHSWLHRLFTPSYTSVIAPKYSRASLLILYTLREEHRCVVTYPSIIVCCSKCRKKKLSPYSWRLCKSIGYGTCTNQAWLN